MDTRQEIQVKQKREREHKEKGTIPARVFLPPTDIYETQDALRVTVEMPGVNKNNVDIRVEDGVLTVEGQLDFSKYEGLQPLYTEYNIGHYSRSFRLSTQIDQSKIGAERTFAIAGFPPWAMTGAMRVRWMMEHEPAIIERAASWLLIEDFVNFRLCGVRATDHRPAATTKSVATRTRKRLPTDQRISAAITWRLRGGAP